MNDDDDKDHHTTLGRIDERLRSLHSIVVRMEKNMERFVELVRYLPVERLVYGLVFIVLAGVLTAIITLVIRQP